MSALGGIDERSRDFDIALDVCLLDIFFLGALPHSISHRCETFDDTA